MCLFEYCCVFPLTVIEAFIDDYFYLNSQFIMGSKLKKYFLSSNI